MHGPLPKFSLNFPNKAELLALLRSIASNSIALTIFDPQYEGILVKQKYGNAEKQKARQALPAMTDASIREQALEIQRITRLRGYVLMWADKLMICEGQIKPFFDTGSDGDLQIVDMVTWAKGTFALGSRLRYTAEYAVLLQKPPFVGHVKREWTKKNIRDVWFEPIEDVNGKLTGTKTGKLKTHTHQKPIGFQQAIIRACTKAGDVIVDPSAGSFSVMHAANALGRDFLGCDILGDKFFVPPTTPNPWE